MQQLTLAITQGHVLKVAADQNEAIHGSPYQQAGIRFIPLPVEILGGWSKQAMYSQDGTFFLVL